jgi:hypothetical protein
MSREIGNGGYYLDIEDTSSSGTTACLLLKSQLDDELDRGSEMTAEQPFFASHLIIVNIQVSDAH